MKKKLKLTLYTKDHEKLFCVIADKKNCEHLSYKGLFCTISPPKSLKDRSLHSEYKQRPLFFTFVVNPKKKKSFSCFHFLFTTVDIGLLPLILSMCVVRLQWAISSTFPQCYRMINFRHLKKGNIFANFNDFKPKKSPFWSF